MAKKKPKKKNAGKQIINVTMNLPKQYLQGATQAAGQKAGQAAVGVLLAHPVVAIVAILISVALLVILGGLALVSVVEIVLPLNITSISMWILSLILSLVLRPKGTGYIIGLAVVVGGLFWGVGIYQEYVAMQDVCNIPIVGWMICSAWNVVTFLPRLYGLGVFIIAAFIQLTLISALRYAILKR